MGSVLVIEDDLHMREVMRNRLERDGHQVFLAVDGEEGVELFSQNQTDVIVTDMILPKKTGIEAIIDLQLQYPRVRIIATSGAKDQLQLAESMGIKKTFIKPFDMNEFLASVNELTCS